MKRTLRNLFKILLFFLVAMSIVFLIIKFQTSQYIFTEATLATTTTAMILGASVMPNGNLSLVLKDRADTTIELYNQKKIKVILVSGDSVSPNHNEVENIDDYLIANNIPEKDIILDNAGLDTYSSMYRAKNIFKLNSFVIITQSFHLPRAIFIARNLGIDVDGVSADKHNYSFYNYFREIFADVKSIFDLSTSRKVN